MTIVESVRKVTAGGVERDAKKVARVRLENHIVAYLNVVAPDLGAQDTLNIALQATDAVEEVLAGYPQKGITGE